MKEKKSKYNEKSKEQTIKYIKTHIHRVELKYTIDEYENEILPAAQKAGLPVATFIRQAVKKEIEKLK